MWLHEGKIFNYPKPGATPFNSQDAALAAMQTVGEEILGLGRVSALTIARPMLCCTLPGLRGVALCT